MDKNNEATSQAMERRLPEGRNALRHELESELRGLILAARMHGFRVCITGTAMEYEVHDQKVAS